jgi:uncharacterized protein with PIN domain
MGAILDLLKDIPLSAVIKERLIQAEAKIATLEKENAILKDENRNLKVLRNQPKTHKPGDECPFCHQNALQLLEIKKSPIPSLAVLGIRQGYYKCGNCQKNYDKEIKG